MLVNQLGNNQPTVPSRYAIAQDAVAVKEIKRAANDADPYRIGEPVRNNLTPATRARPGKMILQNQLTLTPIGFIFRREPPYLTHSGPAIFPKADIEFSCLKEFFSVDTAQSGTFGCQ